MNNIEIFLISLGLAMDAFSVSICKGLTMKYKFKRNAFLMALSFSIFQMLMPLIGYFLGNTLSNKLINFNGDESLTGKIILVKVTDAKTWSLDGEIDE